MKVSLKKNLIANYFGQGWVALMGLAFIPLYIEYLGVEAYGLIGIYAMLQAWLSLLDMGMRPALGREMARFTGGVHDAQSIWDLLRSVEFVAIVIAVAIGSGIWLASGWLASDWVQAEKMSAEVVAQAFTLMGLVTALRFVENIYNSSIAGLQRQVLQNIIVSVMATIRSVGAVGVLLWVSPTIEAFFIWQGLISLLTVVILIGAVYRILPSPPHTASFSLMALLGIWRFAAGMVGITLLSLLLMQVDKILLSRLLTLEAFGYYALAGVVASALYMFTKPIAAAFYPRFVELLTREDDMSLRKSYHQGAQLVTVLMGSAAVVLIVFADRVLFLWTADPVLTQQVAPLMTVLALGTLLNGLMWMPYQMQLAHGWTSLTVKINTIAVAILIPAILLVVPEYGAISAAWIWVALNASYILIGIHFMYQRILVAEKWIWYRADVLIPLTVAGLVALLCRWGFSEQLGRMGEFFVVAGSSVAVLVATSLSAPLVRRQIVQYLPQHIQKYFQIDKV